MMKQNVWFEQCENVLEDVQHKNVLDELLSMHEADFPFEGNGTTKGGEDWLRNYRWTTFSLSKKQTPWLQNLCEKLVMKFPEGTHAPDDVTIIRYTKPEATGGRPPKQAMLHHCDNAAWAYTFTYTIKER